MSRSKLTEYEKDLHTRLRDPEFAAEYINGFLDEDKGNITDAFLIALEHVAKAYGIGDIADETQLNRESMYKALKAGANPALRTTLAIMYALGLRLAVSARKPKKKRRSA